MSDTRLGGVFKKCCFRAALFSIYAPFSSLTRLSTLTYTDTKQVSKGECRYEDRCGKVTAYLKAVPAQIVRAREEKLNIPRRVKRSPNLRSLHPPKHFARFFQKKTVIF